MKLSPFPVILTFCWTDRAQLRQHSSHSNLQRRLV